MKRMDVNDEFDRWILPPRLGCPLPERVCCRRPSRSWETRGDWSQPGSFHSNPSQPVVYEKLWSRCRPPGTLGLPVE
jgi:hypothetical protein